MLDATPPSGGSVVSRIMAPEHLLPGLAYVLSNRHVLELLRADGADPVEGGRTLAHVYGTLGRGTPPGYIGGTTYVCDLLRRLPAEEAGFVHRSMVVGALDAFYIANKEVAAWDLDTMTPAQGMDNSDEAAFLAFYVSSAASLVVNVDAPENSAALRTDLRRERNHRDTHEALIIPAGADVFWRLALEEPIASITGLDGQQILRILLYNGMFHPDLTQLETALNEYNAR